MYQSKYDFVKVRVWLGENKSHYYVLSRFLVSRTLTSILVPNPIALKLALELKKYLVDNDMFDVQQSEVEKLLFAAMQRRGYGSSYEESFRTVTNFYHVRTPLLILVCGTCCTGKSTLASMLAQSMNLPNVLQTDMLTELLRDSESNSPLPRGPLWSRRCPRDDFATEFRRECRIVLKAIEGSLKKVIRDGKSIIIEGLHLEPAIVMQFIKTLTEEEGGGGEGAVRKPIVVPIVLKVEPAEHAVMLDAWFETRMTELDGLEDSPEPDKAAISETITVIQNFLTSCDDDDVRIVNISGALFNEALHSTHAHILSCMRRSQES